MQLARTIVEERQLKEIAMQQALAQARAELHEKLTVSSVIVDDKSAYSVWSAVPSGPDPTHDVMDDMIEDSEAELVSGRETPVEKWPAHVFDSCNVNSRSGMFSGRRALGLAFENSGITKRTRHVCV